MKTDASYRFILKQMGLIIYIDIRSADFLLALMLLQRMDIYKYIYMLTVESPVIGFIVLQNHKRVKSCSLSIIQTVCNQRRIQVVLRLSKHSNK